MAVTLVRKSSVEPNITNRDDTRMIRYAYGGYNGYVKSFGSELEPTIDQRTETLHIGSGRIVLQGWEVDIDEAGVTVQIISAATNAVFLEVNLLTESASIQTVYAGGDNEPSVNPGDDLTASSNGVARLLLFKTDGLNSVSREVLPIDYVSDHILRHEDRIEGLEGFVNDLRNHCIQFTAYDDSYTYRLSISFNLVRSNNKGFTLTDFIGAGTFNCSGVFASVSTHDGQLKSYSVDQISFKTHGSGWEAVIRYWDMEALDPIITTMLNRTEAPNFRFSDKVVNI